MACCGRSKRRRVKYVWTSDDGETQLVYDTEVAARAKVIRKGGTYVAKEA